MTFSEVLDSILGSPKKTEALLQRVAPSLEDPDRTEALFFELERAQHCDELSSFHPRLAAAYRFAESYALFRQRKLRPASRPLHEPALYRSVWERVPESARGAAFEWLGFVPWSQAGRLGGLSILARGSRHHVDLDPVEFFAAALALRPAGLFLFHNHPAGDLEPSSEDFELTRRIASTCRDLGVRLLGHGIVSPLGERWIGERATTPCDARRAMSPMR